MNAPMHAPGTAFSSREYLRLLETMGLTGNWGWAFAADMQVWSPGLYRLLGLDPTLVQPSYGLMLSLVHSEDQPAMESPAQLMQEGLLRDHTFRVIRPDGSIRILSSRAEIYFAPDGRPRGAAGMILDVTDRERLARAQASGRQNRRSLFDTFKIWTETFGAEDPLQIDPFSVELSGLPLDMVQEDFTRLFAPQERNRLLEQFPAILDLGKPSTRWRSWRGKVRRCSARCSCRSGTFAARSRSGPVSPVRSRLPWRTSRTASGKA
jgi:PAS domain S-box-containing protein